MEKKEKCIRVCFSTLLWGMLAIWLYAAPCNAVEVPADTTLDLDYAIDDDWIDCYGTLNINPGAYVEYGVYAYSGSEVNVYAGELGDWGFISVSEGATVTVYGTAFETGGTALDYGEWTPPGGSAVLDGIYADGTSVDLLIKSSTPIYLAPPAGGPEEITIDIKPGSYPNSVNINGHGVIPVAILGSAEFDVSEIDVSSLIFAGLELRIKGNGTPQCSVEDVSGDFTNPEGAPDGYPDLVCQFVDDPEDWVAGDSTATLTGNLLDGTPIEGTDEISVVQE